MNSLHWSSLYLLLPVLFWGISYIAIKVVLTELEPVEMISARFLLATPTLFLIIKLKGLNLWHVEKKTKLFIAAMMIFLHFWVMATGMKETSASNTAWILTTAPIFIAILGWIYLKETFNFYQWIGLLIACSGVLFLTANGSWSNLSWINSRGDIIILGSCITWAFYTVGTRDITEKVNPLVATFWMTGIAGLIFSPFTLITSGYEKFLQLQSNTLISLVFLGIFCLALAFWLWSEGLARQSAAEVGVYLYVEPLVTMIGAWILIGEMITFWLIIGAVLISLGVYVSEKFGRMKMKEHNI
ncbi:MAG: DMT family transporter [Candidatus Zixiibacteriota bacterium]